MKPTYLLGVAAIVASLWVTVAEAQRPEWCNIATCRITATSCSAARSQCLKIQTQCGGNTAPCEINFETCKQTGKWGSRVYNLTGLKRS